MNGPLKTRAKFKVDSSNNGVVVLNAAQGYESAENKAFFKDTPNGQIKLSVVNEPALAAFVVGKSYYVDFTQVD